MNKNLPNMPETFDRRPYSDDTPLNKYLESNAEWVSNNNEAVEWLADNHTQIRESLESIENAKQAMSETHSSWESRCHAIMAALGIDYGRMNEFLPDTDDDDDAKPRPETAGYIEPDESYIEGDLLTIQEYIESVRIGMLTDYDGMGEVVKNGMVAINMTECEWGKFIYPSQGISVIPKDATHVMWYNK